MTEENVINTNEHVQEAIDTTEPTKSVEISREDKELMAQSNDFIDESDFDSFKLLGLQSKLNDLSKVTDQLKTDQNRLLGDDGDELAEYLDSVVESHTLDELKQLTPREVEDIYTSEDDEPVKFDIPFDNNKQEYEFKRDYLVMRKQTMESIAKLEEETASINAELAAHQEELNHLLDEYGDMEGLIRAKLVSKAENATDDTERALYTKMITSFDNALTLDCVKTYVKSYKGRKIIPDYRNDTMSRKVYKKYLKVIEDLEISANLTGFRDLERKFLDVDDNIVYGKRSNIFIFAVIHYISSWHNKEYSKAEGLFITQLVINLKDLYYDKFVVSDNKTKFINNIKEVIDIIG